MQHPDVPLFSQTDLSTNITDISRIISHTEAQPVESDPTVTSVNSTDEATINDNNDCTV
ncbi:hypothetical protein HAX54_008316, partial [Datura stramonium]|nr:hypothetical protein [Datura stramonium]